MHILSVDYRGRAKGNIGALTHNDIEGTWYPTPGKSFYQGHAKGEKPPRARCRAHTSPLLLELFLSVTNAGSMARMSLRLIMAFVGSSCCQASGRWSRRMKVGRWRSTWMGSTMHAVGDSVFDSNKIFACSRGITSSPAPRLRCCPKSKPCLSAVWTRPRDHDEPLVRSYAALCCRVSIECVPHKMEGR